MDKKENKLGGLLQQIRKTEKKMSVRKLAGLSDVSHSYISQIENNKLDNPPKPSVISKLAWGLSNGDEKEFNAIYNTFMVNAGYAGIRMYDDFKNSLSRFVDERKRILERINLYKIELEEARKKNDVEKIKDLTDKIDEFERTVVNLSHEINDFNETPILFEPHSVKAAKTVDRIVLDEILKSNTPVEINGKILTNDEKEKLFIIANTMFSDKNE